MIEHNIDNPPEWHPAIEDAIRTRPVLAVALHSDPDLVHHLRLLSLFLTALDRHSAATPGRTSLVEALLGDLLPSDRELLDAHHAQQAAIRHAATSLPGPWLMSDDGTPQTDLVCPECRAGKHINCTRMVPVDGPGDLTHRCMCPEAGCAA